MSWQFGLINGKLAEVFFDDKKRILGYCYVNESKYTTKKEKRWIKNDTKQFQLTYRNKKIRDKQTGKIIPWSDEWDNIETP